MAKEVPPNKPHQPPIDHDLELRSLDGVKKTFVPGENIEETFSWLNTETVKLFNELEKKVGHRSKSEIRKDVDSLEAAINSIPQKGLTDQQKIVLRRITTVKTALKIMSLSPREQLGIALRGIREPLDQPSRSGNRISIEHEQFAGGADKSTRQAYVIVPFADRNEKVIIARDNVLILPQDGVLYLKNKSNIEKEIVTANDIKNELAQKEHVEAIHQLKVNQLCKAAQCDGPTPPILAKYSTIQQFIDAIRDPNFEQPTDSSSQKLVAYCRDSRNRLIIKTIKDEKHHITLDLKKSNELEFDAEHPAIAKRGVDDLERTIQKPLSLQQRAKLCYDMIAGLYEMHRAGRTDTLDGYVHGDPKPQNMLLYSTSVGGKEYYRASVMDLGQSKKVKKRNKNDRIKDAYWGNPRFRPSEMVLSQLGDVQGFAFVCIRTLEEGYLKDGKPLIAPTKIIDNGNPNNRRGFEEFLITNAACTQRENTNSFDKISDYSSRFSSVVSEANPEKAQMATSEIHRYIQKLVDTMKEAENKNDPPDRKLLASIDQMGQVLYKMTEADPNKRITAEEALQQFPMGLLRLPEPSEEEASHTERRNTA